MCPAEYHEGISTFGKISLHTAVPFWLFTMLVSILNTQRSPVAKKLLTLCYLM